MLYFAYGSNMSARRLTARIGETASLGNGRLPGYQLRFHKIGMDGSGKCDVFYTGSRSDTVFGSLYTISARQLSLLDVFEGLGVGYARKELSVKDSMGNDFQAYTYLATQIDGGLNPFSWYKHHVIRGALEAALPAQYVNHLSQISATEDVDQSRTLLEMAIYQHR